MGRNGKLNLNFVRFYVIVFGSRCSIFEQKFTAVCFSYEKWPFISKRTVQDRSY